MSKIAEVIRFYDLDEIMNFIRNGGEYPLHHIWCYDKIKEYGIQVGCIEYDNNSLINKIGSKLQIFNLQQQINLLKRSKEFDLIYAPFISDVFLLALFKTVGIYKKPILGLALDTHVPYKSNYIKRLRERIIRYIYRHGIDTVLFFNNNTYNESREYGKLGITEFSTDWGVDLDFFQSFTNQQKNAPSLDFIYTTGGTGRDFNTLIMAFNEIDFKLKITTKHKKLDSICPPNIVIDNSVTPGLDSVGKIRHDYYNSLAIAIPLLKTLDKNTIGVTVLMEAFAMGKPVISTVNPMYPFDLEKEKAGFYVDYNDVEGWKQCINYLINNKDEAREMGERGNYLCRKKYNYNLFSEEVVRCITRMMYSDQKNSD